MEEVHDVREAKSAAEELPVTVLIMVLSAVVSAERGLDFELDIVVMEARTVLDSARMGDSLEEMGEGGR